MFHLRNVFTGECQPDGKKGIACHLCGECLVRVLCLCGFYSGECLVRVSFMWRVSCAEFIVFVRAALCNLCGEFLFRVCIFCSYQFCGRCLAYCRI